MLTFLKKISGLASLTAVVGLLLAGCGQSPLTSDAPDLTVQADQPRQVSYIAFSKLAPFRAAKYNDGALPSVTKTFGPAGDVMQIVDDGDEGAQDDLTAQFEVVQGGLTDDHVITMTLTKGTLSQIVATFAPCGLNFAIESKLQFKVGNDLIDMDLSELIVWHIHGDGTAEQANIWAEVVGDHTIIHVKVPGFSRYGIGDDDGV
jgi:hypothetical protein